MKVTNNEFRGFTDFFRLTHLDLIAIGNGGTRQIGTLPIGGAVELFGATNTVDIVGSSSLVINCGTTLADPDEFIDALDVDAMTVGLPTYNTGDLMVQAAGNSTILGGSLPVKAVSAVTPIYIKVTDAAIASITAGEIVLAWRQLDPLILNQ